MANFTVLNAKPNLGRKNNRERSHTTEWWVRDTGTRKIFKHPNTSILTVSRGCKITRRRLPFL